MNNFKDSYYQGAYFLQTMHSPERRQINLTRMSNSPGVKWKFVYERPKSPMEIKQSPRFPFPTPNRTRTEFSPPPPESFFLKNKELEKICFDLQFNVKIWKQKCEEKDKKIIHQEILINQLNQKIKNLTNSMKSSSPTVQPYPSFGSIETFNSKFCKQLSRLSNLNQQIQCSTVILLERWREDEKGQRLILVLHIQIVKSIKSLKNVLLIMNSEWKSQLQKFFRHQTNKYLEFQKYTIRYVKDIEDVMQLTIKLIIRIINIISNQVKQGLMLGLKAELLSIECQKIELNRESQMEKIIEQLESSINRKNNKQITN